MTKNEMPTEIWVFNNHNSIGDLGFTITKPKEGHIKYIRADQQPAQGAEVLEITYDQLVKNLGILSAARYMRVYAGQLVRIVGEK